MVVTRSKAVSANDSDNLNFEVETDHSLVNPVVETELRNDDDTTLPDADPSLSDEDAKLSPMIDAEVLDSSDEEFLNDDSSNIMMSTQLSLPKDIIFENIFVNQIIQFRNMEDVDKAIADYEVASGNSLSIKFSKKDVRRRYYCRSHVSCTFFASFGLSKNECIILKQYKACHTMERTGTIGSGGRAMKKRLKMTLQPAIDHLYQVKSDDAKPADVVKAAAHLLNMDVSYQQGRRALMKNYVGVAIGAASTYKLIRPYLQSFAELNHDSHVNNQLKNGRIDRLFLCPGQMKNSIMCVRPVISLDACHLKGKDRGTLYIATVKSAMDNVFPIAFGITAENEGTSGWNYFLQNLKTALPCLEENSNNFVFMSDREKGLELALVQCFPRNHSVFCAVHIMRNVLTKFGRVRHDNIMKIAKTHCNIEETKYLSEIGMKSPTARLYIEAIDPTKWRSCQWVTNNCMKRFPSRYGIVSSNISESANSMFNDARSGTWFHTLVQMVQITTNRIAGLRKDYAAEEGLVPWCTKLLEDNYNKSAAYSVQEIDDDTAGTFVVILNQQNWTAAGTTIDNHRLRISTKCCTCGLWQEYDLPCVHAMAYYRKHRRLLLPNIKSNYISSYYTYEMQNQLTAVNLVPVVISRLVMDEEETLPPMNPKRAAGRPKVVRIRNRSKYVNPQEQSRIICQLCHKRGHNQKTCLRRNNHGSNEDAEYLL